MHIVLATPLYPPDIADPAPYTYELARRLSLRHTVTVVTYGRFPEVIANVTIRAVDKRLPTRTRLTQFTHELQAATKDADVLYIQSGMSAELPAMFVHKPTLRMYWRQSAEQKNKSILRRGIAYLIKRRVTIVEPDESLERPEILPFTDDVRAHALWDKAWDRHIVMLEKKMHA
jgi:hypothetical protein